MYSSFISIAAPFNPSLTLYSGARVLNTTKKRRGLLGFWGPLGAFSSPLFNGLNRMEQSLGPSLGVAQERRFISRVSSLTVASL